jgi:hypothetical protein
MSKTMKITFAVATALVGGLLLWPNVNQTTNATTLATGEAVTSC